MDTRPRAERRFLFGGIDICRLDQIPKAQFDRCTTTWCLRKPTEMQCHVQRARRLVLRQRDRTQSGLFSERDAAVHGPGPHQQHLARGTGHLAP